MALRTITKFNRYLWNIVSATRDASFKHLVNFQCSRMLYSKRAEIAEEQVDKTSTDESEPPQEPTYRPFEKSSTYRCIKLPFKKARLANPFPDPFKIIESDTLSDDEKAKQMQAAFQLPQYPKANVGRRHYSTKSKCGHDKGKESCKKVANKDCPAAKSPTCKPKFQRKKCQKEEAPFESFSDLYRSSFKPLKRTECNSCPKKIQPPSEMKPTNKNKKYHTSAALFAKNDSDKPVETTDIQSIESYIKTHNFPYKLMSDFDFPTYCNCSRGITGYSSRPFTYQEYKLAKGERDEYTKRIPAFDKTEIDEKCKKKKESTRVCPEDLLEKKKPNDKPKSNK